jgi:hypothetical protein
VVSKGEGKEGGFQYCVVWLAGVCSASLSSRPVLIAYLMVVHTAFMFGFQFCGSDSAFPPSQ